MKALFIDRIVDLREETKPLRIGEAKIPQPQDDEVLIQVQACGVCHTELDEIEGRTPPAFFPMIPGHQVVGKILETGRAVREVKVGDRVGVAWIFQSCGHCEYCLRGEENLCPEFKATGRDAAGGYAEYMVAKAAYVHLLPATIRDEQAAPLLCAGAIGYRSLRLAGIEDGQSLGLTGFGASAHLVLKLVRAIYPNTKVYVFARSMHEQEFARELGAVWSGDTMDVSPEPLQAIIDTTPVWKPVVGALKNLKPGGRLVINAIRKESSDRDYLLNLDYPRDLWMEKEIKSVANVARRDVREFLEWAARIPIHPEYQTFDFEQANQALLELKQRKIRGAKVLKWR